LGIKLGLESDELNRIEKDYPHDSARCKSEVLACCLRSENPPDWMSVVECFVPNERAPKRIQDTEETPEFYERYWNPGVEILLDK